MSHKQKSFICWAFAISMLAPQPVQADDYQDDTCPGSYIAAGAIGGALAGFATWAFGSYMEWWGAASNEELLEKAMHTALEAKKYDEIMQLVKRRLEFHSQEPTLYSIALIVREAASFNAYTSSLNGFISDLKSLSQKLIKRLHKLERKHKTYDSRLMEEMRMDIQLLALIKKDLQDIADYLQAHRTYFKLFEQEDRLLQKYSRECDMLQQYARHNHLLADALYRSLQRHDLATFGLLSTIDELKRNTKTLKDALRAANGNYIERSRFAGLFLQSLEEVYNIVVTSPAYHTLLIQHETAEREKERLRLERERLENERRIARAHEREARALEEHNKIKAEENFLRELELRDKRLR